MAKFCAGNRLLGEILLFFRGKKKRKIKKEKRKRKIEKVKKKKKSCEVYEPFLHKILRGPGVSRLRPPG